MVLCRSILSLQIFGSRNNMVKEKCTRRDFAVPHHSHI